METSCCILQGAQGAHGQEAVFVADAVDACAPDVKRDGTVRGSVESDASVLIVVHVVPFCEKLIVRSLVVFVERDCACSSSA
jgi:hypothetical protein